MKRYIAPIISAIAAGLVIAGFGIFYFLGFGQIPGASLIRYVFAAGAFAGLVVLVVVLIQRIKEIKRGEEDDLGKY